MPGVGSIRIINGRAVVASANSPNTDTTSTASNSGGAAVSPISFSVNNPSTGFALYDSVSQVSNSIVLALRNISAGENIQISYNNGLLVIDATALIGPQGPAGSIAPISDGLIAGNISGSTAEPTGITLSDYIDSVVSDTEGALFFRDASSWTALTPGTSGQVLKTNGSAANPSWLTLGTMASQAASAVSIGGGTITAALTASSNFNMGSHIITNLADPVADTDAATKSFVQSMSVNFSFPGKPTAAQTVQVGITRSMQLVFGTSNPVTFCITPATSSAVFTLKYVRTGVTTTIGTITFAGAATTATLSSPATINLLLNDILQLVTPGSQDATLADVVITVALARQ